MQDLLSRLDSVIALMEKTTETETATVPAPSPCPPSPTSSSESTGDPAPERMLQDSLSGALATRVEVERAGGGFIARVPIAALRSSGVRLVESALPKCGGEDRPVAVVATQNALRNAERRVMRVLGERWQAAASEFDPRSEGRLCVRLTSRT